MLPKRIGKNKDLIGGNEPRPYLSSATVEVMTGATCLPLDRVSTFKKWKPHSHEEHNELPDMHRLLWDSTVTEYYVTFPLN